MAPSPAALPESPKDNDILSALTAPEYARLLPDLERCPLSLGAVLYEPGERITHAYFPASGIVSLLYVMESGESAEIAIIGSEGMVGVSLFMGGESTTSRAVVQNAGMAWRLEAGVLRREFLFGGSLQTVALRYTQALMTQMTQTAACNRHHPLDQQLCRWLLLSLDRLRGADVTMTLRLIANMLGIDRAGVVAALDSLQSAGIVRYGDGRVTVLDRPMLEARVCECYAVVRNETDRLRRHKLAA